MGYRRALSGAGGIAAGREPLHPGLISDVRHSPAKLRQPQPCMISLRAGAETVSFQGPLEVFTTRPMRPDRSAADRCGSS